ncbi:XRE family transcriptional regulator [Shewanella colwelliana]|uniref:AraC family transcriptional regulator n=1 Tax=Shewanella colwelliana TaxID=23 RepID=UPI00048D732A|nr:AraC family transcriptional regulator [Shewanella colwelliana]GIU17146.1 XRE family transcriptional regulator [Shewanella colwelliana]
MKSIAQLMSALAPNEGINPTALQGVHIFRSSQYGARGPMCYYQGVLIVGQGKKRVYLDNEVFDYDPQNSLVMTVPVPVECETFASVEEPVLVLVIDIDLKLLDELTRVMDAHDQLPTELGESHLPGYFIAQNNQQMESCVIRLLQALLSPLEAQALGGSFLHELLYRLLMLPNAAPLYALALSHTRLSRIDKALSFIHQHYADSIEVEQLASLVNMSTSAFHRGFKEVTASSPIQYVKKIRLNKAKELLQQHGAKAKEAALAVGYESPAQFSREFKRYFKQSPGECIRR